MRARLSVAAALCGALIAAPKAMTAQGAARDSKCLELPIGAASNRHDTTYSFPPAQFVRGPQPVYPASLRGKKINGQVRLQFRIQCDGSVDSTSFVLLLSTDSAFVKPAIRAVLQSTYRPAEYRGQKVSTPVVQNIRFTPDSVI